jgi:hypothetical protein
MTAPIHPKVKSSTAAAAVSGIIVWALGKWVLHGQLDATTTAEVYAAVPAALTFAAGWLTPARPPLVTVAADEKMTPPANPGSP